MSGCFFSETGVHGPSDFLHICSCCFLLLLPQTGVAIPFPLLFLWTHLCIPHVSSRPLVSILQRAASRKFAHLHIHHYYYYYYYQSVFWDSLDSYIMYNLVSNPCDMQGFIFGLVKELLCVHAQYVWMWYGWSQNTWFVCLCLCLLVSLLRYSCCSFLDTSVIGS